MDSQAGGRLFYGAGAGYAVTPTVIALFEERAAAQIAIGALAGRGFRRHQISVVRRDWAKLSDSPHAAGAGFGGLGVLFAGVAPRAIAGLGLVLALGPLGSMLDGARLRQLEQAGYELHGALLLVGFTDGEAGRFTEGVRRGGTLVAVHATEEWAIEAHAVLNQCGG